MKRLFQIITAPFRALWALVRWGWRILTAPFRWAQARWKRSRLYHFFTEEPPDEPIGDLVTRPFQGAEARTVFIQGVLEHLTSMRQHLFRAGVALALTTLLSFLFVERLTDALAVPLGDDAQAVLFSLLTRPTPAAVQQFFELGAQGRAKMLVIEPTEGIGIIMRVALLAGLVLAMPWLVLEVYLFFAPGLMPRTRLTLLWGIPLASLLFITGILFTYFVMLPAAVPFLFSFGGFNAAWRPAKYFDLITSLMFWVGVSFQMPLIIYVLAGLGWIKARQLAEQWRLAVIVIAIVAAMITPTVDPVNMGLVMLPMILLYGFSIIGARIAQAGRERRAQMAAP